MNGDEALREISQRIAKRLAEGQSDEGPGLTLVQEWIAELNKGHQSELTAMARWSKQG